MALSLARRMNNTRTWRASRKTVDRRARRNREIFYGIELRNKGKRREGLLATAEAIFAFESDAARTSVTRRYVLGDVQRQPQTERVHYRRTTRTSFFMI